jgi:hypothetical protein
METLSFDKIKFYNLAGLSKSAKKPKPSDDSTTAGVEAGEPGAQEREIEEEQEWALHVTVRPRRIILRIRLTAQSEKWHFIADVAVFYNREDRCDEEPSLDVVTEFIRILAYPTLLPFLREAIFDLTRRLELPSPQLPTSGAPDELINALAKAQVSHKTDEDS